MCDAIIQSAGGLGNALTIILIVGAILGGWCILGSSQFETSSDTCCGNHSRLHSSMVRMRLDQQWPIALLCITPFGKYRTAFAPVTKSSLHGLRSVRPVRTGAPNLSDGIIL